MNKQLMQRKGIDTYPPGPKERYPREFMIQAFRNPIRAFVGLEQRYGDIVHFKLGKADAYLLSNPDYIKEVLIGRHQNVVKDEHLRVTKPLIGEGLLTSEGEFHHRQKRLVQPAFHHQHLATYSKIMVDYALRLTGEWKEGEILDLHREMSRLTLSIVAKALFDVDVNSESSEIGKALTDSLEFFHRLNNPLAPILDKLPLRGNARFARSKKSLDEIINKIISERRSSGEYPVDLLSMLLQAQDVEGDQKGMTDEHVHDEAMTLFLAGHETTANALTWTWYLLSRSPDVDSKFRAEIDQTLNGRPPTIDDLSHLKYTNAVLTESMRIYPPAWIIGRETLEEMTIGNYLIPKKANVVMSQYVMHHNPKYFPEPERFRPERWTDEMKRSLPKFAYFPFGGGPRVCVGEPFAWMEGVLLLATIAQGWKFEHVPGHKVEMLPRITLRPKYGMLMKLSKAPV